MSRTHKGKYAFPEKKNPIYDCSRSNEMPLIDRITEIDPDSHPESFLAGFRLDLVRHEKRPRKGYIYLKI